MSGCNCPVSDIMREYTTILNELLDNEKDIEASMKQELEEFSAELRCVMQRRLDERRTKRQGELMESSASQRDYDDNHALSNVLATPIKQVIHKQQLGKDKHYSDTPGEPFICGRSLMDPQTPVSYLRSPVELVSSLHKPVIFSKQNSLENPILPSNVLFDNTSVTGELLESPLSLRSRHSIGLENGLGDRIYAHYYESDISLESADAVNKNSTVLLTPVRNQPVGLATPNIA